jgi:hypothetical protein
MKRRHFFQFAGVGSAAVAASGATLLSKLQEPVMASSEEHKHEKIDGKLSTATVSFGLWRTDPPLDRFASPAAGNLHLVIPNVAKIRAGGSVNFIIAGFHLVVVYDHGTTPEEIKRQIPTINPPLLIDVPQNRIYRGLNPQGDPPGVPAPPQDRVEVVHFAEPGLYLVICGIRPHFVNDNMFGYVRVVGKNEKNDE